jgi:nucleoside-diphosphate-sugar epimerase
MSDLYLVTGGAGFIGSAIARALLARGDRVRILDDFSSGKRENLADIRADVELIEGSILDERALGRAVDKVKVIFHEAAIPSVPRSMAEPLENHEANATGTMKVLLAAKRAAVERLVYAASSAAYGDDPRLPKIEDMLTGPISPYGGSKLVGEIYCQVFSAAYGLPTVCLRYFNVFGPRQDPQSEYAAVIPKFITRALAGGTPIIFGDGTQSRDFCYIDNVVEANLKAASAANAAGRVYNVACGVATTLNEVVEVLGTVLGRRIEAQHEPERAGDIKHSVADISAARAALGYTAGISFAEGLRRTVDWYRR